MMTMFVLCLSILSCHDIGTVQAFSLNPNQQQQRGLDVLKTMTTATTSTLMASALGTTGNDIANFDDDDAAAGTDTDDNNMDIGTAVYDTYNHRNSNDNGRRKFLERSYATAVVSMITSMIFESTVARPRPVYAADGGEEIGLPSRADVSAAFDIIRYEVSDPNGGVAYMQGRIDEGDFVGLIEFTKTYDLELRKKNMGKAKKLLQSKDVKSKATEYANAVTFDLIGINRSSRNGQESTESANKYLQELRDDAAKFLELESTIQVAD